MDLFLPSPNKKEEKKGAYRVETSPKNGVPIFYVHCFPLAQL